MVAVWVDCCVCALLGVSLLIDPHALVVLFLAEPNIADHNALVTFLGRLLGFGMLMTITATAAAVTVWGKRARGPVVVVWCVVWLGVLLILCFTSDDAYNDAGFISTTVERGDEDEDDDLSPPVQYLWSKEWPALAFLMGLSSFMVLIHAGVLMHNAWFDSTSTRPPRRRPESLVVEEEEEEEKEGLLSEPLLSSTGGGVVVEEKEDRRELDSFTGSFMEAGEVAHEEEEEEEGKEEEGRKYSSRRLMRLAAPHKLWLYAGCMALIVRLPFSLSIPHFVTAILNALYNGDEDEALENILYLFIAGTIDSLMDFWCVFLFGYAKIRIIKSLRLELFSAILRQEAGFFDATLTGDICSRLTADCAEMANDLTWVFRFAIEATVRIGGIMVYMFIRSPKLGGVACAIIPITAAVNKVYGDWLHENAKAVQSALAAANATAQETISSIRTVFSFANERADHAKYAHCVEHHYRLNVKQTYIQAVYYMFVSTFLINTCVQSALLLYGTHLCIHEGLGTSVLLAFMLYQGQLQEYFMNLLNSFTSLVKSAGAGAKVFELLDRQPRRRRKAHNRPGPGSGSVAPAGMVSFNCVHFTYPSRDTPVLTGVSFSASPGEIVALVGSSGSGKSTLFHLLENLYQPGAGSVLLDGVPVEALDHRWLHRHIGLVGQEPVLFVGTIEDNILYSVLNDLFENGDEQQLLTNGVRERYRARVENAARVANAHNFITALPDGYETEIGERGVQLSGGQKQRIAIARAILQDPAVLLLDEATSALDSESESLVQEALEQAMRGRTVLVIAHRLSTIAHAGRIVVLSDGEVVEMGTHSELMARPETPLPATSYRALVRRQTLGR